MAVASVCRQCGTTFRHQPASSAGYFCSQACYHANVGLPAIVQSTCLTCGKVFEAPRTQNRKYCSRACFGQTVQGPKNPQWKGPVEKACLYCGKGFQCKVAHKDRAKFCSHSCKAKHTWEHLTPEQRAVSLRNLEADQSPRSMLASHSTREWREISRRIQERDNHTCQKCGETKKRLMVHHIIPYRVCLHHNEDNLITLCGRCHTYADKQSRKLYPFE